MARSKAFQFCPAEKVRVKRLPFGYGRRRNYPQNQTNLWPIRVASLAVSSLVIFLNLENSKMKKKRYTEERIIGILRETEVPGTQIPSIVRSATRT